MYGKVVWVNTKKGCGYLRRPLTGEYFSFDNTAVQAAGFEPVKQGQAIEFDIEPRIGSIVLAAVNLRHPKKYKIIRTRAPMIPCDMTVRH